MDVTMPQSLLRTKFLVPHVDHPLIDRPGLLQQISAGLKGDLTLIAAPAGYGKTTLVAQWAVQANQCVAWLSLDERDNDIAQFLDSVAAAIQTVFPDACTQLRDILMQSHLPDVHSLATYLGNECEDLPERIVLVLDDFHYAADPSIHRLMDELLRYSLRFVHLVIITRRQPDLALGRMRGNRRLHELNSHQLRLTLDETKVLLEQNHNGAYSSQTIDAMYARSEGWVAGLHLMSLTPDDTAGRVPSMTTEPLSDHYVAEYLIEQVLQHQPPAVRDFLLKTSILDHVSSGLAEAVVGMDAPVEVTLPSLAKAGLFVSASDNSGIWYTYHALFHELLQKQLNATTSPREIAVLHRRASAWLCQHSYYDEALRHALAASDTQLAVQIVVDHFVEWVERDGWRAIERRIKLLPGDVADAHPWLLMARAYALQMQYNWQGLVPLLTKAEQQYGSPDYPLAPAKQRLLRSYLDALWAVHWSSRTDAAKATEAAERALPELPLDHTYVRGVLHLFLTLSMQASGAAATAEQMLTAAIAQAEVSPSSAMAVLRPYLCLLTLSFASGHIAAAIEISREYLQKAIVAKSRFDQLLAHLALGAATYEMNDLEAAAEHFQQGSNLRFAGQAHVEHDCLLGLALTYHAMGQQEAVKAVMAQIAAREVDLASRALAAETLSLQHRLGIAPAWASMSAVLQRNPPARMCIWHGWVEIAAITQVRVALSEGRQRNLALAATVLGELLPMARELHRPAIEAALLALKALLLSEQGHKSAALQVLKEALALGEELGFVRSIADAGPQLEPLLAEIGRTQPSPYLEQVRAALTAPGEQCKQRDSRYAEQFLPSPLTRREREVLSLLGEYRTDREIADMLVISPLTVRTHIENLASKLSVSGRRAIVKQAREQGLLN